MQGQNNSGGAPISRTEAEEYVNRFKKDSAPGTIYADLFNAEAIKRALEAPGAEALRFFYGKDETGSIRLIMIPADKEGHSVFEHADGSSAIYQRGLPCPPYCDLL